MTLRVKSGNLPSQHSSDFFIMDINCVLCETGIEVVRNVGSDFLILDPAWAVRSQ
jgi:hypothetical protein